MLNGRAVKGASLEQGRRGGDDIKPTWAIYFVLGKSGSERPRGVCLGVSTAVSALLVHARGSDFTILETCFLLLLTHWAGGLEGKKEGCLKELGERSGGAFFAPLYIGYDNPDLDSSGGQVFRLNPSGKDAKPFGKL
eukprot:1349403-Amorphochlora_amoeboformis.AAC.2